MMSVKVTSCFIAARLALIAVAGEHLNPPIVGNPFSDQGRNISVSFPVWIPTSARAIDVTCTTTVFSAKALWLTAYSANQIDSSLPSPILRAGSVLQRYSGSDCTQYNSVAGNPPSDSPQATLCFSSNLPKRHNTILVSHTKPFFILVKIIPIAPAPVPVSQFDAPRVVTIFPSFELRTRLASRGPVRNKDMAFTALLLLHTVQCITNVSPCKA